MGKLMNWKSNECGNSGCQILNLELFILILHPSYCIPHPSSLILYLSPFILIFCLDSLHRGKLYLIGFRSLRRRILLHRSEGAGTAIAD